MTQPKKVKHKKRQSKTSRDKNKYYYHDDLKGCEAFLRSEFSKPDKPLYRWTKTPTTLNDIVPQYYLNFDKEDELELEATIEERVERNTVSMYTSEEASRIAYSDILNRLDKKDKRELNDSSSGHKGQFIDRCGSYVSKFNLAEEDALVGKENKKGHVNVILKHGFDFDKCLDKDFGTKKILEDEV